MSAQRVFVTTVEGNPSFLVHSKVRDKFIDEEVKSRHGLHPDGGAHEWQAFDAAALAQAAETKGEEAQG